MLAFRGEANFSAQNDEIQGTDNEICTIASPSVLSRINESGSRPGFDQTEGLWNTTVVEVFTHFDQDGLLA